jgi:hypothetical protein
MTPAQKQKQNIQMEMNMKKIIGSALVAIALIGTAVSASAAPFPGQDSTLSETLNFWAQFSDDNN